MSTLPKLTAITLAALFASACQLSQIMDSSGPDDVVAAVGPMSGSSATGGLGNGVEFGYGERPNPMAAGWDLRKAVKTDTGIWALYRDPDGDSSILTRFDWDSKTWSEAVSSDEVITDFTVPRTNDQGNYAVMVTPFSSLPGEAFLLGGDEVDIEALEVTPWYVAQAWGSGDVVSDTWMGGRSNVYKSNGTVCCPRGWDHLGSFSGQVQEMWASSRSDAFALVHTASELYVAYGPQSVGGPVLNGLKAVGLGTISLQVAFDVSTGSPYAMASSGIDATLMRIDVDPNARSGTAVPLANLDGGLAIDVENGVIYASGGRTFDLNGQLFGSWAGKLDPNNPSGLGAMAGIVMGPLYIFVDPTFGGDTLMAYAFVDGKWSWFETPLARRTPYSNPMVP